MGGISCAMVPPRPVATDGGRGASTLVIRIGAGRPN